MLSFQFSAESKVEGRGLGWRFQSDGLRLYRAGYLIQAFDPFQNYLDRGHRIAKIPETTDPTQIFGPSFSVV